MFCHCFPLSFPTSTVSGSADGCCLTLRRQLCASEHARPQNLCQSMGPQRRGVMGYGCRLTMWLWCHYDMFFVNSGLVMHTKAISHWCQSCCLFLNMAVLGIYLWFQTIWQTKQCWLESTPWKDCMSSWKGYIVPVRNFSLSEGTLHSVHYVVNMSMGYVLSLFK